MRLGIRSKLLVWLVLVTLPIAAASSFAVRVIDARLTERIEADLANARRLEAARINDVLAGYERDALELAGGPHVKLFFSAIARHRAGTLEPGTVIGNIDGFPIIDPTASMPLQVLAEAMRRKAAMVGSDIVDLKLVGTDGETLGITEGFSWQPYDRQIVSKVLDNGEVAFGNAFRNADEASRVGLVAPVFDLHGGVIGALILETRLGPIVNLIAKHEGVGSTSEAHIAQRTVTGDAEFITHLRFKRDAAFNLVVPRERNVPITQALASPEGKVLHAFDYRQAESILALQTIEKTGWGLVVKIDAAEAFAPVAEVRGVVTLAALVTVTVVVLGWMAFLHPIASRLQRAARAAERVASGDYQSPIGDRTLDEIGYISRSIDRLATDLDADIRMRATAEEQLIHQAIHDEMTGLFNRKYANEKISELCETQAETSASIMFLDLDGFKRVNDRFGHAAGDEVLVTVARRLSAAIEQGDTLARWGGDEFVIIMPEADAARATDMAERIRYLFAEPVMTSFGRHLLGCSIGLASSNEHQSLEQVLLEADARMYREKQSRGSHRSIPSTAATMVETALDENRLEIWYQPIVAARNLGSPKVIGAEALVRVRARHGGIVVPGDFLPDIRSRRVGRELDRQVLLRSLAALARWRRSGMVNSSFRLSVNLTGQTLSDPALLGDIRNQCESLHLPPSALGLEISEETRSIDHGLLHALRTLGVQIAIDDIGLQHSNMDRLVALRPDGVKIDRCWLNDLAGHPRGDLFGDNNQNTRVVLPRLIEIAQSLGAEVIAEGVETETQFDLLCSLGVERFQGFLFDTPQPAAVFISRWGALGFDADLEGGLRLPIAS